MYLKLLFENYCMTKKTFISAESRLREIISFIKLQLKASNVADEKIKKVHLIAEEVLTNIMEYAYPCIEKSDCKEIIDNMNTPLATIPRTPITVKVDINDAKDLMLHFTDKGILFDFYARQKKSSPMKKPEAGGLGIYFIDKLADSVEYKRDHNRNILKVLMRNV